MHDVVVICIRKLSQQLKRGSFAAVVGGGEEDIVDLVVGQYNNDTGVVLGVMVWCFGGDSC